MRRARWQTTISARARHTAALTLLVAGVTLSVAACGRIPESVAATLSAPTAAPTRTAAPAPPTSAAMSGGASGMPAASAFKLAEMPMGNPDSGQRIYVQGCANCHGMTGTGGGGNQVALVGNGGLIVMKNLDTASKFAMAFTANAAHAGIKDNDQIVSPQRLTNMYAYLVAQLNG